jgi:hypothetical protein
VLPLQFVWEGFVERACGAYKWGVVGLVGLAVEFSLRVIESLHTYGVLVPLELLIEKE